MTHLTCRLTAKNQDQLRNPTLGNQVWATFTFTLPNLSLSSLLGNITQFIIQQHNCTHNKNTWWKRRATSDTTFCRTIQLEWEIWRKVFLTFSSIIFTSASFLCFFVWYGFASSASKFGSPAPRKCNTDKLTTKNVRHSCLQCCCLQ